MKGCFSKKRWLPVASQLVLIIAACGCASTAIQFPYAVKSNNLDLAKRALEAGANVNAGIVPPILDAAFEGHTDMMKLLLDRGALPDATNRYGVTALIFAAQKAHGDIVHMLVERGADVNHRDVAGVTPMMMAAFGGDMDSVQFLLERGARADVVCTNGFSPLIYAAQRGSTNVALLLLDHGVEVDRQTMAGDTALLWAACKGHVGIVGALLDKGASVNHRSKDGNTPMTVAAGIPELYDLLLRAGADIGATNGVGWTPLAQVAALRQGNIGLAQRLIDGGADLEARTVEGDSVFNVACRNGNLDLAAYLYERGSPDLCASAEIGGIEVNAVGQHVVGDYHVAKDEWAKARGAYEKALGFCKQAADKYSGDITMINLKEFGLLTLAAVAGSYQAQMQSRQDAQMAALAYANRSNTGIDGYGAYLSRYQSAYVPTYQAFGAGPLYAMPQDVPMNAKKAFAKAKVDTYKQRQSLLEKVIACLDSGGDGRQVHECIASVAPAVSGPSK